MLLLAGVLFQLCCGSAPASKSASLSALCTCQCCLSLLLLSDFCRLSASVDAASHSLAVFCSRWTSTTTRSCRRQTPAGRSCGTCESLPHLLPPADVTGFLSSVDFFRPLDALRFLVLHSREHAQAAYMGCSPVHSGFWCIERRSWVLAHRLPITGLIGAQAAPVIKTQRLSRVSACALGG